jgi:hypothetical protein
MSSLNADQNDVHTWRKNCAANHIDTSRAKMQAVSAQDNASLAAKGMAGAEFYSYKVIFDKPLFPINAFLEHVPAVEYVFDVYHAEKAMLMGLWQIQRAERLTCRQGRVVGWATADVVQKPLTADEISEYEHTRKHRAKMAELAAELAAVTSNNAKAAQRAKGLESLQARYRVEPAAAMLATTPQSAAVGQSKPKRGSV